jgi:hypothetical protein
MGLFGNKRKPEGEPAAAPAREDGDTRQREASGQQELPRPQAEAAPDRDTDDGPEEAADEAGTREDVRRRPPTPPAPDAKLLVFDIAVTGLPTDWHAPYTDTGNWPRLVAIAWTFMNGRGKAGETRSYIIRPDDFEIPKLAEKVNGVSMKRALKEGVPLSYVLADLKQCLEWADVIVAHNIDYKTTVIRCEAHRIELELPLDDKARFCTMRGTKRLCRIILPDKSGYKYPTFLELYSFCFKKPCYRPFERPTEIEGEGAVVQYLLEQRELRLKAR